MIVADRVNKAFGRVRAVQDLSFEVRPGEAVALWGTNGAGKTTVIRCVLGVIRFRGRLAIDGLDVRRRGKAVRARVGYVPQELAFHDDMRVGEALRFFGALRGVDRRRSAELLERVGLAGNEAKRVRELSGGMKQRLALALALLSDPPVVILDEPTSNLDARARDQVVQTLAGLKAEGKTILFASHRPEEIAALADRVLLLEKGRLVGEEAGNEFPIRSAFQGLLRLEIGAEQIARALSTLAANGMTARRNGRGVYVDVEPAGKVKPIRVLTRAGVFVSDFEILPVDPHATEAAR